MCCWRVPGFHSCPPGAGFPFILLNTLCGAYCAYGLSALRYSASAVILWGVMMALNALIAIQLMVFCVYLTPNQVRSHLLPAQQRGPTPGAPLTDPNSCCFTCWSW